VPTPSSLQNNRSDMLDFKKSTLTYKLLSASIIGCSIGLSTLFYLNPGLSQIQSAKKNSSDDNLAQATERKGQIPAKRMNIAGVKIGMKISEVIQLLGKPKRQKISSGAPSIEGDYVDLFYPGLEVRLTTDRPNKLLTASVYEVIIKGSRYSTGDGIRIGDSQNKVIQTYGTPEINIVESKKFIGYWRKPYGTGGLSFEIKDGVVREISLGVSII
jgi:hypothetical protein